MSLIILVPTGTKPRRHDGSFDFSHKVPFLALCSLKKMQTSSVLFITFVPEVIQQVSEVLCWIVLCWPAHVSAVRALYSHHHLLWCLIQSGHTLFICRPPLWSVSRTFFFFFCTFLPRWPPCHRISQPFSDTQHHFRIIAGLVACFLLWRTPVCTRSQASWQAVRAYSKPTE